MRSTLKCDIIVSKDFNNAMVRQMKKKIVYISGADSFDAAQVRAAFDEVRSTLGLDSDTVLFGVPVDDLIAVENAPVAADSVEVSAAETVKEPSVTAEKEAAPQKKEKNTAPVVPILSVLGGNEEKKSDTIHDVNEESITETVETIEMNEVSEFDDIGDIDEMLKDEAPVENHEKTLEELLETMTPLREDAHVEEESINKNSEPATAEDSLDDADATLASLATEFVDVQDKVPTFKKSPERGKISKLKNILPFKKKKHDDTGIMGDLFGWAGVAANDEDFSIPGFFTNVASKK